MPVVVVIVTATLVLKSKAGRASEVSAIRASLELIEWHVTARGSQSRVVLLANSCNLPREQT